MKYPMAGALQRKMATKLSGNPKSKRKNATDPDDDMDADILNGMAGAIWVTSWASWLEEQDRATQKELGPGSGGNLESVAPPAPESAALAAMDLYTLIERANDQTPAELFQRACEADGCECDEENADLFGHYLAMQAMGHGVSWFDDHKKFPLKFPVKGFEANSFDGEDLEWSPRVRSTHNGGSR